jgi:Family of unknown function (DUF5675)
MKLVLTRKIFTDESTIGDLKIDGAFECVSLEDVERDVKIKGETAIPRGSYEVFLKKSPKFGRLMPTLRDVPGFIGILIHWGNTAKDTEGCILVGRASAKNFVGSSKAAFADLFAKIEAAVAAGEKVTIQVKGSSG